MRFTRWATYLWPGLPQLWYEGAWSGLALAVGFAALLNLLLLASLVWVELLEPAVLRFGWVALALAWASSLVVLGWGGKSKAAVVRAVVQQDLFRQALAEYLRGAWFEAESLLRQIVDADPRDVDARLMLATLLRHTKRPADARGQLFELERLERAAKWRTEIEQEQQLLAEVERFAADKRTDSPEMPISRAA